MDFRQYDSAIGRFVGIDVLAETSTSVTPYHFGFNNPVFWADPSGLLSQSAIDAMWNRTPNGGSSTWTNNGVGFASGNQNIDYDGYETLPPIFIEGTKSRSTGNFLGFKSANLVGGFKYGLAEKARDQAYQFGSAYQSRRDGIETRQIDEFQGSLDGIGTADPTGFADGLNAIIYGFRGQWRYAGISAIAIIPYAGDVAKGGKYASKAENVISASDLLRIENAATRIGKPITVVGSRASGTANAYSDWDYVIEGGLNSKNWSKIKNSLPGAKSTIDNVGRNMDIFTGSVNTSLPHIKINPR
jgi:hypothetical protein